MLDGKKILAIITARGGSKGIPRKNVIDFGGQPLISWTIQAALQSRYIDRTILSSDDAEIIEVAKVWGCEVPFVRPTELASDQSSSLDVVRHAVQMVDDCPLIVLLQPTSPFRKSTHIDACLEQHAKKSSRNTISVCGISEHPSWMFRLKGDRLERLTSTSAERRQDLDDELVIPNGAIYVIERALLFESQSLITSEASAYVMKTEDSLDIDEPLDLVIGRALWNAQGPVNAETPCV